MPLPHLPPPLPHLTSYRPTHHIEGMPNANCLFPDWSDCLAVLQCHRCPAPSNHMVQGRGHDIIIRALHHWTQWLPWSFSHLYGNYRGCRGVHLCGFKHLQRDG